MKEGKWFRRWPVLYALLLTLFTVFVLLDTFVIPRTYSLVESTAEPAESPDESASAPGTAEPDLPAVITESSYDDGNICITITEYREYDTSIYVADIVLSSPEYLKTALADDTYGRNITDATSSIAEQHSAILAINGDYYGAQNDGYVIRNGIIYRSTSGGSSREDLVIAENGTLEIVTEGTFTAEELLNNGAVQVLSFGPGLIENGEISVTEDAEVGKAKVSNPRTALGVIDSLHYVFVVADGRTSESEGLSLYELASFMTSLGVTTAYNLDGGGSSTLYFNGQVVNNPTTNGKSIKERSVSDIVCIGY